MAASPCLAVAYALFCLLLFLVYMRIVSPCLALCSTVLPALLTMFHRDLEQNADANRSKHILLVFKIFRVSSNRSKHG
jgi:hypothetical protein